MILIQSMWKEELNESPNSASLKSYIRYNHETDRKHFTALSFFTFIFWYILLIILSYIYLNKVSNFYLYLKMFTV